MKPLERMLAPVVSDPFIPENIRNAVIDLLKNRLLESNFGAVCTRSLTYLVQFIIGSNVNDKPYKFSDGINTWRRLFLLHAVMMQLER